MSEKTLAEKLLLVSLAIENGFVITVGLAGGTMWLVGRVGEVGFSDPWEAFLASCLTFSGRVTLAFLILGGLAWFLWRVKSRALAAPIGVDAEASRPWFFLITVVLGVHGALAAIFAYPLFPLFQENIRLLQSWGVWEGLRRGGEFSGIFFVPVFGMFLAPSLAAITALSFITGATTSLDYFILGFEESSRVLLRSICLQIAFLLGLFFTHTLFEAGTRMVTEGFHGPDGMELKVQVLSWIAGQAGIIVPMTRRLAWLLPGFFVCAAVVLWKAHKKQSRDAPSHD